MADIKIGNLNIDSFKVGSSDCKVYLGDTLLYPQGGSHKYLTFVALENTTFSFNGTKATNRLSYSTDGGTTWSEPSSAITTSTISSGNTIMWKGSDVSTKWTGLGSFSSSGCFDIQGNIMSLLFGDNFVNKNDLSEFINSFTYLFSGCTGLTSAENLVLPATTLADYCYASMFEGCTSLTTVPQLPATTLATQCYQEMFYKCTSLTTAPQLIATTLASSCYAGMFRNCTSLTTAPQLPATTLANQCYLLMFEDCTSLTTAPQLPATTLADSCYRAMFEYCTSLTTAPQLPATTLVDGCYVHMFYGCTSLNKVTCLATDISVTNCTKSWVSGVRANGTFTKASSMSSWTTGINGIPSGWTINNYS